MSPQDVASLLAQLDAGQILPPGDAETLMEELLGGRMLTSEIVRFLRALNARAVHAQELATFAAVMRRHSACVFADGEPRPEHMIDTCGTGGDGFDAFNISTAAAIVAAAAGARVAKHGNRAASSRSGSADVLEQLGVRVDLPCARFGEAIRKIGIGFLFAQTAHTAARHAAPARKQVGTRTLFNLLGPLTNPAGAHAQVLGVFARDVIDLMAATLAELGVKRAFVVHGAGGLDEISLAGETFIGEVRSGSVRRYSVEPEEFGVKPQPLDAIRGGSPAENAATIRDVFAGRGGARRDIVVVNAAAALVAADIATNFKDGAFYAARAIDSGTAQAKLEELVQFTTDTRLRPS
jgi:anthranilate phosphoribosyltransferase